MDYRIEVRQGCIDINSVTPLYESEDALVLDVDCRQKYPELEGLGADDERDEIHFYLGWGDRTLDVASRDTPASGVIVHVAGQWWTGVQENKHGCILTLVRRADFDASRFDAPNGKAWCAQDLGGNGNTPQEPHPAAAEPTPATAALRPREGCKDLDPGWPGLFGKPRGPVLCRVYPRCACGAEDQQVGRPVVKAKR